MLCASGTLTARALKGLRASRLRVARSVATVIGISLSIPMSVADNGSVEALDPKRYIRFNYDSSESLCLIKLYGKESAFKTDAIGNLSSPTKSYVYGIPQLKNPIIKDLSAIEQINYGMKYIDHRYDGLPCKAWEHWLKKGWH
jgi:hypothetical protein